MSRASTRRPTEFRYAENVAKPANVRLRKALRLLFGADPTLPDDLIERYAASYYDADPVAEKVIEELYLTQGQAKGRALVDRALELGIDAVPDAPEALRSLFAEIEVDPPWLDWELVDRGARVFRRFGTHLFSFAGAITLHGYRESSVAKPLALTGAYNGESANRRFLETACFWVDVSEPDGLRPGADGVRTAVRVRLMHVFVRQNLMAHAEWNLDAWGVPISQGDALLTLMGGSFLPGMLLRLMGYRTTRGDIEALLHFWRYVGHLIGVQPRWYPETVHEALGLMFTAHVKGVARAGDDARELAHSYLASYGPQRGDSALTAAAKRWERRVQLGYMRFFMPPSTFRHYGLPRAGLWRFHPLAQAPFIFAAESLGRHLPAFGRWRDQRVRRATRKWVKTRLGERATEYKAVEQFTR